MIASTVEGNRGVELLDVGGLEGRRAGGHGSVRVLHRVWREDRARERRMDRRRDANQGSHHQVQEEAVVAEGERALVHQVPGREFSVNTSIPYL